MMRLRSLRLREVRGIADRTVELLPEDGDRGVAVVEGPNEIGKSTLTHALQALLRYKDRSQHRDVRSLQTEGRDEGAEVTAELQCGSYRLTYRKRFGKRPETELVVHEPAGERLRGDEAHHRVEAILDETIDTDLWDRLCLEQAGGLAQPDLGASHGLAAALEQRTGTSAISDHDLEVLDRVRTEHQAYFTDQGRERKQPLGAARERVADAGSELEGIDAALAALAGDIDRADRVERELPGLRQQVREADERAAELARQREQVEALQQQVTDRQRAVEAAATRAEQLTERRRGRDKLADELTAAEAEQADLDAALSGADAELAAADERLQAAHDELEVAHARQRDARAERERAQADVDLLRGREELAALRRRVERADAAGAALRDAETQLERIAVDDALLDELRAAQREVDRADAVLEAASPELRFTAGGAVDVAAGDERRSLGAGETASWTVAGVLTLAIGEAGAIGEVAVHAGAGTDDARAAAQQARRDRDGLLARAGVASLDAAEAAGRRRRDLEQHRDEARRALEDALDGDTSDELADRLDRLQARVDAHEADRGREPPLPTDVDAARQALETARQAETAAEDAVAEPQAAVERARAEQQRCHTAVTQQRTRRVELDRTLARLRAELADVRAELSDAELAAAADRAEAEREQAETALGDARRALAAADADAVVTQATNAAAVADDARQRLADAERELRDLRTRIEVRGGDGLHEQREAAAAELAHAEAELASLEQRATAAKVLLETLERHRAEVRERYAAPMREQLVRFGRMLFGDDFDVELDEGLRVARRRLDGLWLDTSQLSVGAREQLALLTRLACATLLADAGGVLLFDDALGHTDPERLEAVGAVLRLAAEHCQVVVLTSSPDRFRHVGGARRVRLG